MILTMAESEFVAVAVSNPMGETFTQKYNGEPYTLASGETKNFAKSVSYHIAYHLSAKMIEDEFEWSKKKTKTPQEINQEATRFSQLTLYDNPKRRIALYKILGDTIQVMEALAKYPIIYRGYLEGNHLGTMDEYREFVEKGGGKFEVKSPQEKETIESLNEKIKKLEALIESKPKTEEKKDEPPKEQTPPPAKKAGRPRKD